MSSSSNSARWTAGRRKRESGSLSRNERRTLKALGVRFGAFSLYLPSLLEPKGAAASRSPTPISRALPGGRTRGRSILCRAQFRARRRSRCGACAPSGSSPRRSPSLSGSTRSRALAWPEGAGAIDVTDALLASLKWRRDDAHHILRALGYARVRNGEGAERAIFRRRHQASDEVALGTGPAATPFAALAALTKPSSAAMRRARRAKARRRQAGRAGS